MTRQHTVRFTQEGYEKTQQEYGQLLESRKDAVTEVSRAAEMGDRSENAAYKVGKQKLRSIDSRLRHLKKILANGEVIVPSQNGIDIGSTVVVNDGNSDFTFRIVGDYEADPLQNKISAYSPIGRALIGKKIGDIIRVKIPAGDVEYTIKLCK